MRILIDTHTLIWAAEAPQKLGAGAVAALNDPANELFVSAGSIWELAIKLSLGKLSLSMPCKTWIEQVLMDLSASVLPITVEHAEAQAELPWRHRDPFDRLLAAQARVEDMTLVSTDLVFDGYNVPRIW